MRLELLALADATATRLAGGDDLVRIFGDGVRSQSDDGQETLVLTRGSDVGRLHWRPTPSGPTFSVAIAASQANGWMADATFKFLREFDYVALWPAGVGTLRARQDVPVPAPYNAVRTILAESATDIETALAETPGYVEMFGNR